MKTTFKDRNGNIYFVNDERVADMTREEARKRVSEAYNIVGSGKEFVNALEALGLIKFDEPEIIFRCLGNTMTLEEIKELLGRSGYGVYKL